jgi:hypothetical protein
MQRNAIEDEVRKHERHHDQKGSTDPNTPAPSLSHAVATLGGNALNSKGQLKETRKHEYRDSGDEGTQVLLDGDENSEEASPPQSRWGGIEEDFADSSASDSYHTDDEEELNDVTIDLGESNSEADSRPTGQMKQAKSKN